MKTQNEPSDLSPDDRFAYSEGEMGFEDDEGKSQRIGDIPESYQKLIDENKKKAEDRKRGAR